MSWGMVAVAGASVVGGVMASNSASKDRKAAGQASAAELEFAQQQYDDWQAVYGPLEQNLANYYSNLTPDYYEVQGIEMFEKERAAESERLREILAQRGLDPDSGIAAGLELEQSIDAAQTRAGIRVDAERMAREDQLRFLQVGLGQNPTQSMERALARRTDRTERQKQISNQAEADARGSAISSVGTAVDAYTRGGKI